MSLESVAVSSIMIRDVKKVPEGEFLQQACEVMSFNKIGSVIVMAGSDELSEREPVGILTDSDVVRHIAKDPARSHSSVRSLMSHPLITVSPNASLKAALLLIVTKDIRRLPVVDNKKLVGIVTDKDIYRTIAKNEALVSSLISDQSLAKHIESLDQPWVYKLGEVLHRRTGTGISES